MQRIRLVAQVKALLSMRHSASEIVSFLLEQSGEATEEAACYAGAVLEAGLGLSVTEPEIRPAIEHIAGILDALVWTQKEEVSLLVDIQLACARGALALPLFGSIIQSLFVLGIISCESLTVFYYEDAGLGQRDRILELTEPVLRFARWESSFE